LGPDGVGFEGGEQRGAQQNENHFQPPSVKTTRAARPPTTASSQPRLSVTARSARATCPRAYRHAGGHFHHDITSARRCKCFFAIKIFLRINACQKHYILCICRGPKSSREREERLAFAPSRSWLRLEKQKSMPIHIIVAETEPLLSEG